MPAPISCMRVRVCRLPRGRSAARNERLPHFDHDARTEFHPSRYSGVMLRGDQVICVSETVRDYALRNYPHTNPARLTVIPRGVDPAAFPRDTVPDAEWREQFLARHPQLDSGRLLLLPARGTR